MTTAPRPVEHEVVVVGARVAGAATAMLLARQGHDVLLVDRATFPSDTLSTHAIARGGMVQLHRWGLLEQLVATGAPPIRRVHFHADGATLTREIKARAGVDHLLAPRRSILDTLLIDAAAEAGATVRTGTSVSRVVHDASGRVSGVEVHDDDPTASIVRSKLVIGADGVRSRIARAVGARTLDDRRADGAAHYTYVGGMELDGFEFHVGDGGFAGVFPTHDGEANVWICQPAEGSALDGDRTTAFVGQIERISPALAERVRRGAVTAPVRSAVRFPNHIREAWGPGWALVGDAGYHRDPITGHGITDALRDAELLASHAGRALRGDQPEAVAMRAYGDERLAALTPIFDVTCQLAAYPPRDEFVALQRELSALIEAEACWLAERAPLPTAGELVAA